MLYPNRNHNSPHPVNGGNGAVPALPAPHTWKFPLVLERAVEELCHDHPGHMPVGFVRANGLRQIGPSRSVLGCTIPTVISTVRPRYSPRGYDVHPLPVVTAAG